MRCHSRPVVVLPIRLLHSPILYTPSAACHRTRPPTTAVAWRPSSDPSNPQRLHQVQEDGLVPWFPIVLSPQSIPLHNIFSFPLLICACIFVFLSNQRRIQYSLRPHPCSLAEHIPNTWRFVLYTPFSQTRKEHKLNYPHIGAGLLHRLNTVT